MASDSDGCSSAVVLKSIREKLVEYKESLLRQLVDEREAALASSKEHSEDNAEKIESRVQLTGDGSGISSLPDTNLTVKSSVTADKPVERASPAKTTEEEVGMKKRRLTEAENAAFEVETDVNCTKKVKRSNSKVQQQPLEGLESGERIVTEEMKLMATKFPQEQEVLVPGVPYRVVRTPVPPNKYLMLKRREEEASDREGLRQQYQPVLLSSSSSETTDHRVNNGVPEGKRPVSIPRSSSISIDSTNIEFERGLRESVRLHREVKKRSLTVTRKRQLPRLPTPARGKSQWDFLLEEMKWMATDFAQERNWKRVMQYRLAANVIIAQNAGVMRQEQDSRQVARGVALQVSAFWRTMERIAARSRVRFEATGSDSSNQVELDDAMTGDQFVEDDTKRSKADELSAATADDGAVTLKYRTIDIAETKFDEKGRGKADAALASAKTQMNYIVSAGKRARSAMTCSSSENSDVEKSATWSQREAAFRDLQARCSALQKKGGPTIILAAFQLLALRWMLDLYSSGLNIFLNDQLGMGKAATIVAFLSLIEIVSFQKEYPQLNPQEGDTEDGNSDNSIGPHLIIVSEEELHKWMYYLRIWHPDRRIQLYGGAGAEHTLSNREKLQREWKRTPRSHHKNEDAFLIAPPMEDDEELDDDERAEPLYCVLCPVTAFTRDREAFVAFTNWQMVVVENEHDGLFDDSACVSALQQLRQQQRRVLCNGLSIENWTNTALRLQYAEFLVREAPAIMDTKATEGTQYRVEVWPVQQLQVERISVAEVLQLYGKSSSVRASLWKASQQEDSSQHMNALLLALSCLSLRRVRSEVEPELGKIEEISLSCQPSLSQQTQYRNALSGFAATLVTAGGREERLSVWIQLLLRLREICNCVDIVNDMDKLGHADLRTLTSSSAKLEALEPLLRRLALQEGKKVVIYCQFNAMFPILELFLSLLDVTYVRVSGSIAMQRRALCHFADRPVVRVALVSTRLSMSDGRRAASIFGGEAIIVVDGDWNATCDAKLRASWAKMAVGGSDTLPVYRLHCENTVEASLLRVGASLTEKVFGEMTPHELLAVPSDLASSLAIEKPSWWFLTATSSNGTGLTGSGTTAKLASVAQQVERDEKYCGGLSELEMPLIVHNVDLDAEEHLLLANTDELTPVEWYAVNYVHGVTDKKQQQVSEGKMVERDADSIEDDRNVSWGDNNAFLHSDQRSFEKLAVAEVNRRWQDGDTVSQLFYNMDSRSSTGLDENALEKVLMRMRMEGMETHFDVYKPPEPPSVDDFSSKSLGYLSSEVGTTVDTQMTFKISYRVPAPPLPQVGKSKLDHGVGYVDPSKLTKSSKKQRANAAALAARGGVTSGMNNTGLTSVGVKRKLESQLGGMKSGALKEQRVDLEGIPVPDISEFADDDFWGDTNLDALDSAEWDDPALLGGILGVGVGGTGAGTSLTTSSSATSSEMGSSTALAVGGTTAGVGSHGEVGHKAGSQKSSKKSKTGTGRARKSSMSADSGREIWSAHDDIVLKKLFELYGANWTLIAQVFNSATAVSRFVCKKRSPRQCYDRYGKIISGSLTTGSSVTGTAAVKAQRAAAANAFAAQLTPAVLDARIGLPQSELLVTFSQRHSMPGLPPPSIVNTPNLVEMTLAYRKKQIVAEAGKKGTGVYSGGLDDLKSIKTSFDAIIQCMKHKTSPPPIPIPIGGSTTAMSTPVTTTVSSTDLGTKASLTAASFPASQGSTSVQVTTTPPKKTTVSPVATAKSMPVVVPPPHKSHTDMISLLPSAVLGPDEVIKRSKEAAVVAVQAAAAVASVGRDGSPLSASGDVMLGAGSGFGATVSGSMPRRSHAASLTSEMRSVGIQPVAAVQQTPRASTTAAWGGSLLPGVNANGLDAALPMDLNSAANGSEQRNAPMPVTTSTLLHVLDRMPEIKNKIQSILNRTDCSESQKVAMIARLLSNTNAINNTNALGSAPTVASEANTSVVLSALTADSGMLSSSDMLIDTETPIPMPSSLATPNNVNSQGTFQPPASSQP